MAILELKNLKKTYGKGAQSVAVIHGVDMRIADGEFVVIVGPSGCGKSTLLRMVAGLEEISSGQVLIDGTVVNEKEPAERDIAMVFQNYALYPHMKVYDNMAYGLRIRGMSTEEIAKRVNIAADILELKPLLERKPKQLSGGQRQRVAMGRAIVREPKVFLFDEPLSNLDAKLRVQMRLEIKQLHNRLKTTSLYVTHDQVEAMTLAQRMIVMNSGVAEQIGTPKEVYETPASTFVASFIGSPPMNILKGSLSANGAFYTLSGAADYALAKALPAHGGKPYQLGIRPEHLRPVNDQENGSGIPFTVSLVESLGSDYLVHGSCPGLDKPQEIVLRTTKDSFAAGQHLQLTADPEQLHWFEEKSGKRVKC
ncbi:MAG: sn-glycerol-3-phosphate import ATP-binding protein UgpC [Burkholderiaceae bacterium]|nr:sn-glycerol-3-phosphate import ATP-binding protein UgpC [Burkholderiaceae bacterium]